MLSLQDHYPVPDFIPHLNNEEFRQLKPEKKCPTCEDKGTFLWDHDQDGLVDEPVEWQCACLEQVVLRNYLQRCGLSQQLFWRGMDELPIFDSGDMEQLLEYVDNVEDYLRAGLSLSLSGNSFNGKSTWATYLMKKFISIQKDVQSLNLDVLTDAYSATWGSKTKDSQQQQASMDYFSQRVINVPILMIDNIGRNKQRSDVSSVQQAFLRVTNDRAEAGRPTILTFCEELDPKKPYVTTSHLEGTMIPLVLGGRNLSQTNIKRKLSDVERNIKRPIRLT